MIKFIDVSGKTEDEAIQCALKQLARNRDEVSIEIIAHAKSGFLGFGSTPAMVRVTYDDGRNNKVACLNIGSDVDERIRECFRTGSNSLQLACTFINNYFDAAKHGDLTPSGEYRSFGMSADFGKMIYNMFTMHGGISGTLDQDSFDQSALYCNLYPNAFKKLADDMIEYYRVPELERTINRITIHAQEEDGPYEAMIRARGIVEPF